MTSVLDHGRQPTRTTWLAGGVASALLLAAVGLIGTAAPAQAALADPVLLGTADPFAVLAGAGITNTGTTTINGDTGTFPNTTVTGGTGIVQTGTPYGGNAPTPDAKTDLRTATVNAAGQGPRTTDFSQAPELGGQTLVPGVYGSDSELALTGALTLDAGGNPAAVFLFQAGSTLTTASSSTVVLLNGAQACNVFWQVGSSATLGTDSVFRGTLLAETSISAATRATVEGRLLANTGAVTLQSNTITRPLCATTTPTSTSAAPSSSAAPTTSAGPTSAGPTTPAGPTTTPAGGPGTPGGTTGSGAGGTPGGGTPTGAGGTGGNGNGGNGGGGNGTRGTGVFSQVDTVPVGSVDTGDGSAAGPPSTP